MTAVEWLEFRYKNNVNLMDYDFKHAKEMERQQIINARLSLDNSIHFEDALELAEQYYNETFNK